MGLTAESADGQQNLEYSGALKGGYGLGAMAEADALPLPTLSDPTLRVLIDRLRWLALAPAFWEEANRRLRANGLPSAKFQKNPAKPIPVQPSLAKELCILCWAVEEACRTTSPMPSATGKRSPPGNAGGCLP